MTVLRFSSPNMRKELKNVVRLNAERAVRLAPRPLPWPPVRILTAEFRRSARTDHVQNLYSNTARRVESARNAIFTGHRGQRAGTRPKQTRGETVSDPSANMRDYRNDGEREREKKERSVRQASQKIFNITNNMTVRRCVPFGRAMYLLKKKLLARNNASDWFTAA